MFPVLRFLAWGAFELGHAEDTGAIEGLSILLYGTGEVFVFTAGFCIVKHQITFRNF